METKLKQEPVADGGGLPPLDAGKEARRLVAERMWPLNSMEQQLADKMWATPQPGSFSDAAFDVIANLLEAYASSQESLRAAREENERLKRENIELTNGGSLWRNRAISAETSLSGMDRLESPIEVALRERMQQAVEKLIHSEVAYTGQARNVAIAEAISLLSPEGSSR